MKCVVVNWFELCDAVKQANKLGERAYIKSIYGKADKNRVHVKDISSILIWTEKEEK